MTAENNVKNHKDFPKKHLYAKKLSPKVFSLQSFERGKWKSRKRSTKGICVPFLCLSKTRMLWALEISFRASHAKATRIDCDLKWLSHSKDFKKQKARFQLKSIKKKINGNKYLKRIWKQREIQHSTNTLGNGKNDTPYLQEISHGYNKENAKN